MNYKWQGSRFRHKIVCRDASFSILFINYDYTVWHMGILSISHGTVKSDFNWCLFGLRWAKAVKEIVICGKSVWKYEP